MQLDILKIYFHSKDKHQDVQNEYHDWMHTKTFFDTVCYLAELVEIEPEKIQLLKIAALYHDRGYAKGAENHEEESAKIARKELPYFNISQQDIDEISGLIISTKMPTYPKNISEMIMCDADQEVLGRDYFPYTSELLREETGKEKEQWQKIQIKYIKNHTYYTKSAKKLFNRQKQQNLDQLLLIH